MRAQSNQNSDSMQYKNERSTRSLARSMQSRNVQRKEDISLSARDDEAKDAFRSRGQDVYMNAGRQAECVKREVESTYRVALPLMFFWSSIPVVL